MKKPLLPRKKLQTIRRGDYPQPGDAGGNLIREVVAFLRSSGIQLPITSHIHIAVSGGADSTALAHLLAKYGRRVALPSLLSLVHVNHGWRGEQSDLDEKFVIELGARFAVPVQSFRIRPAQPVEPAKKVKTNASWEDVARNDRKSVFAKLSASSGPESFIFTAHQADDLAETVLWRLCTGAAETHGGGIAVQVGREIRPFLRTRKALLEAYLREEGLEWRVDSTNFEGRFQRSKMRLTLMPALESLFPRAVEHLVALALKAQKMESQGSISSQTMGGDPEILLRAQGLRARRPHWNALNEVAEKVQLDPNWEGELHMPGGWRLARELSGSRRRRQFRWVLEPLGCGENP